MDLFAEETRLKKCGRTVKCQKLLKENESEIDHIKQHMADDTFKAQGLTHEELFADMIAIFAHNNPSIVAQALEPIIGSGATRETVGARDAAIDWSISAADKLNISSGGHYAITAPVRSYLWKVAETYRSQGSDKRGEILQAMMKAHCTMLQRITGKESAFANQTSKTFVDSFYAELTKASPLFTQVKPTW